MRVKWVFTYLLIAAGILFVSIVGSRTVTVMVENAPIERSCCIILDAGHGGFDGGASSCTGVPESKINLEIVLKLQDLLHLLGYNTKMIRTEDVSVDTSGDRISQRKISDLKERVRLVNETPNAILLSIHQNHFSDSRYSGAQVFYNSSPKSRELANSMQRALIASVNPGSKRECKPGSGIYLLEHTNSTGVLVECGFLSHPGEEALLRNANYQKKLCCIIAVTTACFLSDA